MGGSSSHRRKSIRAFRNASRRNSPSNPRLIPSTTPTNRVLNFDHLQITDGVGYHLLRKSGWSPGDSLGSSPSNDQTPVQQQTQQQQSLEISHPNDNSSSTPIPIVIKHGRGGIGAPHRTLSDDQFLANQSPITPQSCPTRLPNRIDMLKWQHDSSPDLVKQLANMDIYDPLRPRCQYDSSHVVRNLKALHKHELSCPANPNRSTSRRESFSSNVFHLISSNNTHHSGNPFTTLAPDNQSLTDSNDYPSDDDDDDCSMSTLSDYTDDEESLHSSFDQQNLYIVESSNTNVPGTQNQSTSSIDVRGVL